MTIAFDAVASSSTFTLLELFQWPSFGVSAVRAVAKQARQAGVDPRQVGAHRSPAAAERARADARTIEQRWRRIVDACTAHDVRIVSLLDTAYPAMLARIEDAPPFLFVKGSVEALSWRSVAVVGTRKASEAGLRAAYVIARHLAARSVCVVSGLALGIDAAGHKGALAGKGPTVAVLAHGLDTVSPSSHRELAEQIVASGGALVSEHAPGVPPRPAEFVRRNRIQSGLSYASVIVESADAGGAIHQANFTHGQKRGLFVVLPHQNSPLAGLNDAGARRLMDELNATPVRGTADLAVGLKKLGLLSDVAVETADPASQRELQW
jgi:DNA processing protein